MDLQEGRKRYAHTVWSRFGLFNVLVALLARPKRYKCVVSLKIEVQKLGRLLKFKQCFYCFVLISLSLPCFLNAQEEVDFSCGFVRSEYLQNDQAYQQQIHFYENQYLQLNTALLKSTSAISDIPVKVHVATETDGSQEPWLALEEGDIDEMIEKLNVDFADAFLRFYLCGEVNFIHDSELNDYFFLDDEADFLAEHYVPKVVNILITKRMSVCGSAGGAGHDNDLIQLRKNCASGSTLSHEMGHYFDLEHTHAAELDPADNELVDGSNCHVAGDAICDTPADPGLGFSNIDDDCNYTGNELDLNGEMYQPLTNNLMSYSLTSCRNAFTPQQNARMFATYKVARTYLSCAGESVNFVVDHRNHCTVPATVQFRSTSQGAIAWQWDVDGDDVIDYVSENPTHTYIDPGVYDVRLTVETNVGGDMDTLTKVYRDYIHIAQPIILSTTFIKLVLKTDLIPEDNTWVFTQNGDTLFSADFYDNFEDDFQTFEYVFPVEDGGCYLFAITDRFGNGLLQGPGSGYYALYDDADNELVKKTFFHIRDEVLFKITNPVNSIAQVTNEVTVNVFPNPSREQITLDFRHSTSTALEVQLTDALGKSVLQQEIKHGSTKITLAIDHLARGVYYLLFYHSSGVVSKRVILH